MMFERIQVIREVNGDHNIIVNGDLCCDSLALEKVAQQFLEKEIEKMTSEAQVIMRDAVHNCVTCITEKILDNHLQDKIIEFTSPAVQYAYYATLRGYAFSETIEQREFIVDAFIERIQKGWKSVDKLVLDDVLEVLPKLTPQALALLGLLQLRHQVNLTSIFLDSYFKNLNTLVETVDSIESIDIEYLKQIRILLPVPGIRPIVSLEETLLYQYDLFFRHPILASAFDNYCRENPEVLHGIKFLNVDTNMMYALDSKREYLKFLVANSQHFKEHLQKINLGYMIPHVETLKNMMPAFTKEELRDYFIKLSPRWEQLFTLFESDSIRTSYMSMVGFYIGGKVLAKVSHSNVPLPINNYRLFK